MIELRDWIRSVSLPAKPWLILGKGPSFSRRTEFDLSQFNLLSLNHVVRAQKVDVAHVIDLDVVGECGEALLHNCRWLLMPRRPHVHFGATQVLLLEDFVRDNPILRQLDAEGRLVWYNLSTGAPVGDSPPIGVYYFSSEAALNLLAQMGARTIRSLGLDGGRGYSASFRDLESKTHLAGGHSSFDLQFQEMQRIIHKHDLDYAPLVEPLRVFVGTDEASMMGTRVLEYSIRKFASRPVELVPMLDFPVPRPKDEANRPRTGFSFSRFLIPKLCNYRGRALYLDSDMQVFADLAELWQIPFGKHKVLCTNQPDTPEAWKHNSFFHPGRQMSVMLLDCSRLDWDINEIVRGLDEGKYTYPQLMFELCLVKPDEIADAIPPEWNCLEHFKPGWSKLLHYTVVPMQPWKNEDNPLRNIWMDCFHEAMQAGAINAIELRQHIERGHVKPALAEALRNAPQPAPARAATYRCGPEATPTDRMQVLEVELRAAQAEAQAQALRAQAESHEAAAARAASLQAVQVAKDLRAKAKGLQQALAVMQQSWAWRIGSAVTRPVNLVRKTITGKPSKKAG